MRSVVADRFTVRHNSERMELFQGLSNVLSIESGVQVQVLSPALVKKTAHVGCVLM